MKNIVIVGAGGFGREVFGYVADCISAGEQWIFKGFIDDNINALDNYNYPIKVISTISDYTPQPDDFLICALGNPKTKKKNIEFLLEKNAKFETLIHPSAYVGRNVKIGNGVVLCPKVSLTCDISIDDFAMLNVGTGCGHDARVGRYSTISGFCDITGFCEVGEGAFLGSHVSMHPSSKIGNWASVGLGSSVVLNVKDGTSAFGNPAVALHIKK